MSDAEPPRSLTARRPQDQPCGEDAHHEGAPGGDVRWRAELEQRVARRRQGSLDERKDPGAAPQGAEARGGASAFWRTNTW